MAELQVNERQAGDVTILDMSGAVRIGEGSIALRDAIRGLADGGVQAARAADDRQQRMG